MTRRVQVALVPSRAVLWDIDGTLADSKPVHERFFAEACCAPNLDLPEDFHAALVGRMDTESHAWLVRPGSGLRQVGPRAQQVSDDLPQLP